LKNKIKKKVLIVGSNFGQNHYKVLNKYYNFDFFIFSPNILRKKLNFKKATLLNNDDFFIKNKIFHTIVCCTNPENQKKLIFKIIKKKISCKYLMLEKPITDNLRLIKKLTSFCLSNKVNLGVNFTYNQLKISKILSKHLLSPEFKKVFFNLGFHHHYLIKKNNSWKNFIRLGGGIVNYYLIHVIFVFLNIFPNLKINRIKPIIKKKLLTGLNINFKLKKKIILEIDTKLDIKKIVHKYKILKLNEIVEIYTKKNNWYKNYIIKIEKNKKIKILKTTDDLNNTIKLNYERLFKYKKIDQKNYYNLIYSTQKICNDINKKIKKYDFK
tara:strand:+ start:118 stop:1095 length:978 start_codon:yes stop_codon:yes gene_type:complete